MAGSRKLLLDGAIIIRGHIEIVCEAVLWILEILCYPLPSFEKRRGLMARYLPNIAIITICALAWMTLDYLPFQDSPLLSQGYARHFLVGAGLMALVFGGRLFWFVWAALLTVVLLMVELQHLDDPTRQFQVEDIIAQTLGIAVAMLALMFFEQRQAQST